MRPAVARAARILALALAAESTPAVGEGGWSGEFSYSLEQFTNLDGGLETGSAVAGLAYLSVGYEGERFVFHAHGYVPHGDGVSEEHVGDFSVVSNIDTVDEARLQELWFEIPVAVSSSFRPGLFAADVEFWGSAHGALFLNSVFGAATFASGNLPNAPIFPTAALGVRFATVFDPGWTLRAAILDGDAGDPESENRNGWDITLDEGALVLVEAQRDRPNRFGGDDSLRFSLYGHTGELELADGTNVRGSWGLLAVVDRTVAANVGWFARAGLAAPDRSASPGSVETGVVLNGLGGGPGALGFAAAYVRLDPDQVVPASGVSTGYEGILELTYSLPIGPWVELQPTAQLVLSPAGDAAIADAFVFGLRATVQFAF